MSYLPSDRPSFMRNSIAADRTSEEGLKIEINELQQFFKKKYGIIHSMMRRQDVNNIGLTMKRQESEETKKTTKRGV